MAVQPMPLSRKPAPFDHPEWIFELKYDGFRALAVIENGRCTSPKFYPHENRCNLDHTIPTHEFLVKA